MINSNYLDSARKEFEYYKQLGERTMAQIPDDKLNWQFNTETNSVATIVKHLWGNMLSRWTDFLTSDGEKVWRKRDEEFENDINTREAIMKKWDEGWTILLNTIKSLTADDLGKTVYIRNMGHTVVEAINRQIAHYAYHIGQIVHIGKMIQDDQWKSLSIPRGKSASFNADKFAKPKREAHFSDEILKSKKE
jgi:hypothetical protein